MEGGCEEEGERWVNRRNRRWREGMGEGDGEVIMYRDVLLGSLKFPF